MTDARTRILIGALTLFTLWPAVQMTLVAVFDVNAWKLGGYGMYATPSFRPEVSVAVQRAGDSGFSVVTNLAQEQRDELTTFSRARFALGRLSRPDRLAERVFDGMPNVQSIRIRVGELRIDPRSAMLGSRESAFSYSRRAPSR